MARPQQRRWQNRRGIRGVPSAGCVIAVGLFAASCDTTATTGVGSLSADGNMATWAEPPAFTPNFIFPSTMSTAYGTWNI